MKILRTGAAAWLLATSAIGTMAWPMAAMAQSSRSYDIPAGPLAVALNRYAEESGVRLVYDATLAEGLSSPGLKGAYTPRQALSRLLDGSGLVQRSTGSGSITIERAPTGGRDTVSLGTVRVQGSEDAMVGGYESLTSDPVATEGTGSYAAQGSTIFKSPLTQKETPLSLSVLTRQRLDDQNLFNIRDALTQLPGLNVNRAGETNTFYSRGYSVNTQVDGVPMSSGGNANRFDMAIYDRVELLRGPSGTVQGVGAIGGTVNLVRKRPTTEFIVNGDLSYGSWNNLRGSMDVSGPVNDSGSIRGRAVVAYQDRDYFYDYVHNDQVTAYGVMEFDLGSATTLGATVSYTYSKRRGQYYGIPEALVSQVSRSTYPGVSWTGATVRASELGADLTHDFGGGWKGSIKYIHRESEFKYGYLVPLGSPATPTSFTIFLAYKPQGHDTNDGIDASISGPIHFLGGDHFLTVGGNYDRSNTLFDSPSTVVFGNAISPDIDEADISAASNFTNYKLVQWAPYVQAKIDLIEGVTLTTGGRLSRYRNHYRYLRPSGNTEPAAYGKANGRFTPYAGLTWDVTKSVSLYASYADIFQPQTLTSFEGVPFPPVVGWQGEGGVKASLLEGKLNAALSYYRIREKNRALPDLDPAHVNCGYDGGTCYVASGLVQSQGIDFEVTGSPMPGLQLQASYTYNKNEYLADAYYPAGEAFTTSSPRHQVKLWADYQFGKMERADAGRWSIGGGMLAQSKISLGADNPYGQGAYAIFNGQLGFRPTENVRVTLTANNIFDRRYLESVSAFNFFGEPRSIMLAVRFGR